MIKGEEEGVLEGRDTVCTAALSLSLAVRKPLHKCHHRIPTLSKSGLAPTVFHIAHWDQARGKTTFGWKPQWVKGVAGVDCHQPYFLYWNSAFSNDAYEVGISNFFADPVVSWDVSLETVCRE